MSDAYDDAEEGERAGMIKGRGARAPAAAQPRCGAPRWFYAGVLFLGLLAIVVLGGGSGPADPAPGPPSPSLPAAAPTVVPPPAPEPRSPEPELQASMAQMAGQLSDLTLRVASLQARPSPQPTRPGLAPAPAGPSPGEQDIQATLQAVMGQLQGLSTSLDQIAARSDAVGSAASAPPPASAGAAATPDRFPIVATVDLSVVGGAGVAGSVTLTQLDAGSLQIDYDIQGLSAGLHGFHVHGDADFTNGCTSTGSHYNPAGVSHAGPAAGRRHVGDLGNVLAAAGGTAVGTMVDSVARLYGPQSILGRAIVVHADPDDLGVPLRPPSGWHMLHLLAASLACCLRLLRAPRCPQSRRGSPAVPPLALLSLLLLSHLFAAQVP